MSTKHSRENAAANAVAAHLGAVLGFFLTPRKWDDGSDNGMHDFYLDGDGHKIALEVTTIADGQRVGRDMRWSREAPAGWVKVDGLTGYWTAYHEGAAEASDVVRAIRVNMPRFEALDVAQINTVSWREHVFAHPALRPAGYEELRALNLVGIVRASRMADASRESLSEHAGEVQIVRGFGVSRPLDRNFPASVINEQLREQSLHGSDVQKLLAVDDATARHVWMWVEVTEGLAMIRSFETMGPPDVDLDAEGIDGVWVGRSPSPEVVAGHAWVRKLGWSEFSVARDEVVPD